MFSSVVIRLALLVLASTLIVPVTAQQSNPKAFSSTSNELIGLWSGEGEVIEFRSDGKCRYAGDVYPYELSQGHLLIEVGSNKVVFAYEIEDENLILTAAGQRSSYTRMTKGEKTTTPKDGVLAELVGKWCYFTSSTGAYTGRCITLLADGTYDYQQGGHASTMNGSHFGTWYVHGDRLYYQSATAGNGSYKLERRNHPGNNNPTIVLDDAPFVTTVSRPPWR